MEQNDGDLDVEYYKAVVLQQACKIMQLENLLRQTENKTGVDFAEFLGSWLEKQVHLSQNTWATYKSEWTNHFKPYFGERGLLLHEITPEIIEEFYKDKIKSGLSPNFVIRLHSFLFSAFKYAIKYEIISKNPMNIVKRPKEVRFFANWYNAEQLIELFKATHKHKIFVAITLAALLGLRRSEIVGLKWNNVNLSQGTIMIQEKAIIVDKKDKVFNTLKTESSYRMLVLPVTLLVFFKNLKKNQQRLKGNCPKDRQENFKYVCLDMVSDLGLRVTLRQITEGFRNIMKTSDLPRIRFHDLRHSCATFLLHNGCNMRQVQDWLGHSNYSTTARYYAHVDITDKMKTAATLNDLFTFFTEEDFYGVDNEDNN